MFMNASNDKLFNEDKESYKDANGQKVERPKGLLNRTKDQAANATYEWDDFYQKEAPKYLGMVRDPETRLQLQKSIQSEYQNKRNTLIKHEVEQRKVYDQDSQMSAIDVTKQSFASIQDDKTLLEKMDILGNKSGVLAETQDLSFDQTKDRKQKDAEEALGYYLTSLTSQGKYDEALAKVDLVKDRVDADKMKKLVENEKTAASVKAEDDIVGQIIDGTASLESVTQKRDLLGEKKTKKYMDDVVRAQNATIKDITESESDAAGYVDLVDSMISNQTDNFNAKKILVDALKDGYVDNQEAQRLHDIKKNLIDTQWNNKSGPVVNSINSIKSWFGKNNPDNKELAGSLRKLVTEISGGAKPAEASEELLRQSYNKEYPEQPISDKESPFNPPLEKDIKFTPLIEKITKGYGMGVAGMLEGVAGVAGWAKAENIRKAVKGQADLLKDFYSIPDPDFTYYLSGGVASASTFLLPGIGIARGTAALSAFPRIASFLGMSASTLLESTIQAGSDYETALNKGMSPSIASSNATKSFWLNIPTLALTNAMGGLFGVDKGGAIAKALKAAPAEGVQEFTQELISQLLVNDVQMKGLVQSGLIGTIVGGGMGLTASASDNLGDLKETKKVFDDLKTKLESERGQAINPFNPEGQSDNFAKDEQGNPIQVNAQSSEIGGQTVQVTGGQVTEATGQPPTTPTGQEQAVVPPENPVNKVIKALSEAVPLREEQAQLYKEERGKRFAKAFATGEQVKGEQGYYATLGQLKGDLPKVQFESIRSKLSEQDINDLFEQIRTSPKIKQLDQLAAGKGLAKLLGEYGGNVPTDNEIDLLNKVYGKDFTDSLLKFKPFIDRMKEFGYQLFNVPRSIMSSFDLSAPLRQGVFMVGRKEFLPAFVDMFKAFGSERGFRAIEQDIANNQHFDLAVDSGLALTDMDGTLNQREEAFMSNWAEKIPGVRASGRAYSGFLNKLRMDVFSDMVNKARQVGRNIEDETDLPKKIAQYVNTATGRGSLGEFQQSAKLLNTFLFSPRLIASRLSLLNPLYYVNQDPFVRKEIMKDLMSFSGLLLTTLGLASAAGAKVSADPRNADFGKIKIGNTRFDIAGGFLQYLRIAAQLWTGEIVSSTTGKTLDVHKGNITRFDIIDRFVRNKQSPIFSFARNLLEGEDSVGQKTDAGKEIGNLFTPMVIGSLYDISQDDPNLLPAGVVGAFGVGVQTYKSKSNKQKKSNRF